MINLTISEFLLAKAGKATKTIQGYRSVLYLFRDHVGPAPWPPTPAQIDAFLNDAKQRRYLIVGDEGRAKRHKDHSPRGKL